MTKFIFLSEFDDEDIEKGKQFLKNIKIKEFALIVKLLLFCSAKKENSAKTTFEPLKNQITMLKGRKRSKTKRWSAEDKGVALSIFNTSPKAYKILTTQYALPCAKTLQRAMSKIDLNPGK